MPPKKRDTGFAVRLKELREAAGLSQQQLAERAGMHLYGIAKLEQGVREPGWVTVLDLAAALGVEPNDFLPADKPAPKKRKGGAK